MSQRLLSGHIPGIRPNRDQLKGIRLSATRNIRKARNGAPNFEWTPPSRLMVVLEACANPSPLPIELTIIGTGQYQQQLQLLTRELGIDDRVRRNIEIILDDRQMLETMGRSGRRRILDYFTWSRTAAEYLRIYDSVLESAALVTDT